MKKIGIITVAGLLYLITSPTMCRSADTRGDALCLFNLCGPTSELGLLNGVCEVLCDLGGYTSSVCQPYESEEPGKPTDSAICGCFDKTHDGVLITSEVCFGLAGIVCGSCQYFGEPLCTQEQEGVVKVQCTDKIQPVSLSFKNSTT